MFMVGRVLRETDSGTIKFTIKEEKMTSKLTYPRGGGMYLGGEFILAFFTP